VAVQHRVLQEPPEQVGAGMARAPVEAELELVQVALQVLACAFWRMHLHLEEVESE
jgi:hypothetical protein